MARLPRRDVVAARDCRGIHVSPCSLPLAGPHPHCRYLHNIVTHSLYDKVYGSATGPVIGG